MAVAGTFTPEQNERWKAALEQDRPYEFALETFRRKLEQGYRAEDLRHQLETGAGGGKRNGYRYEVMHGLFTVTLWHGKPCFWRMGVGRLITDAKYLMLGAPKQPSLFESQPTLWEEATA